VALQKNQNVMKIRHCRFCKAELSQIFVDLGKTPLANSFLTKIYEEKKEPKYPLCAYVCKDCFLVQLEEFVSPEKIFSEYAYFSSFSETWLKHAENYVNLMLKKFSFDKKSQVVEIASNDGYLLQFFKKEGIPILGIEPAANVAKVAEQKGIPTIVKFFGIETATELVKEGKSADLIIGNNVLAHVPNLNDFVDGLKILLKQTGVITLEFPYLMKLIQHNQFDTIYHEHFSYFSLFVTNTIFSHHKLKIFDVEQLPTHGGSLRIFATHNENENITISKKVNELINQEHQFGLSNIDTYRNFSNKVESVREKLLSFLNSAKKEDKKVVCYGAAAKGNTLLNYCGIDTKYVDYVADMSTYKQGLFLPGTHIPIVHPEKIKKTKPDYLVILTWNLKDEIMKQMSYIREWGGKFVVPIPEVEILS